MHHTLTTWKCGIVFGLLAMVSCMADGEADDLENVVAAVPAKGSASTLDIASWNIEWFGSTGNGPKNETLQLQNARDVIKGTDFDIWGLIEIVSASQFDSMLAQLPEYDGFLANDPMVENGAAFYTAGEQKVGLLYRSSVVSVERARLILTSNENDFAGRPPLEVTLETTIDGATDSLVVIVVHTKALTDTASWQRRLNASNALKAYLDSTYPTTRVIVIGDFNDDIDTSTSKGKPSPYANFVADTAGYFFPTKALTDAGVSSTVGFRDMIDHHLATNELMASYVAESAEVYRVDKFVSSYGSTTSDHYPVLSRYNPSGSGGKASVFINEVCANEPGSSTAGEFIELRNEGSKAADLGGFTLADTTQLRHTFADGTILNPGQAIVVFGGVSAIPAGLSNGVAASTGTLSLGNGGDRVVLADPAGSTVDSLDYSSALAGKDGVSMNRSPDGSAAGTFVLHDSISALPSSPGTQASGAAW